MAREREDLGGRVGLLADLNIAPRTVVLLRSLGHDVVRIDALHPGTAPDVEIVAVALREGRIILT